MKLVILGAGFGGLTLARELGDYIRETPGANGSLQVHLIDAAPLFRMGLSNAFVLQGHFNPQDLGTSYKHLRNADLIQFHQAKVVKVHPEEKEVEIQNLTESGETSGENHRLTYDRLVVGLGASYFPEIIPGLREASFNLCNAADNVGIKEALSGIQEGQTVVMAVSRLPYKCPLAPVEWAILAHQILADRGIREKCRVAIVSPESQAVPLSRKAGKELLEPMLTERGIEMLWNHTISEIDPASKVIKFQGKGETLSFDLLISTWPQKAPDCLKDSGFLNEAGFFPSDYTTFETKYPGILAIGDCSWSVLPNSENYEPNLGKKKPYPKAGEVAKNQGFYLAQVLKSEFEKEQGAQEIRPELRKSIEDAKEALNGVFCGMETGCKLGTLVKANLQISPTSEGPVFEMKQPSTEGWEEIRKYWENTMLYWFNKIEA